MAKWSRLGRRGRRGSTVSRGGSNGQPSPPIAKRLPSPNATTLAVVLGAGGHPSGSDFNDAGGSAQSRSQPSCRGQPANFATRQRPCILSDSFTPRLRRTPQTDDAASRTVMIGCRVRAKRPRLPTRGPDAGPRCQRLPGRQTMVQVDFRRRRSRPRPANSAPNRDIEAGSGMPGGGGLTGV